MIIVFRLVGYIYLFIFISFFFSQQNYIIFTYSDKGNSTVCIEKSLNTSKILYSHVLVSLVKLLATTNASNYD